MKKEFKGNELSGYKIGEYISIHSHINDPESWFLTIRPLNIFGYSLCKKTQTEAEIARYIYLELHKKLNIITALVKDVYPFT